MFVGKIWADKEKSKAFQVVFLYTDTHLPNLKKRRQRLKYVAEKVSNILCVVGKNFVRR